MNGIIGRKIGMTSIYDSAGKNVACTVIEAGPNVVTQVKTTDSDGYNAIQLAFGEKRAKSTTKPLAGHFAKAETAPKSAVKEFRDYPLVKTLGELVKVNEVLKEGDKVAAIGVSKGKGFQGVVTRHNFSGVGARTHGQHDRERAPGSVGASSYPSKVVKGLRMAGHLGSDRVKVRNLKVVKILEDKNLVLIHGVVPGAKGSIVMIVK